jgi:hypothetical protein
MNSSSLIFTIFLLTFSLSAEQKLSSKFKNNEVLTYVAKWTGVPAGEIVLSSRISQVGDQQYFDMGMFAKSTGVLKMVYKLRETIYTRVYANNFTSKRFKKESKQGRRHYKEDFVFDYEKQEVRFEKNNLINKGAPEKKVHKIEKKGDVILDPLSVLFYIRNLSFSKENSKSPELKVCADKKGIYTIQYKLVNISHINSTAFGRRKVYHIQPTAEFKGTIVDSGKLDLWVDVETGVLMRIKMSIPVGYASLELRSAKGSDLKYQSYKSRRKR